MERETLAPAHYQGLLTFIRSCVCLEIQPLSSNRHMNSYILAQTITTVFLFLNQTADAGVFFFPPLRLANLLILHSLGETDNKDDGFQR